MTTTETGDDGTGRTEEEQSERLLPIDYTWLRYAFYGAIIVWSIYLLFKATSWTRQEDYLVPYLVLSLLIGLCVLRIIQLRFPIFAYVVEQFQPDPERDFRSFDEDEDLVEAKEKYEEITAGSETTSEEEKRLILGLAWILILPVILYVLGFIVGFPLYVFVFSYFYLRDVRISALVTAIFVVTMYLLFIYLLKAPLYDGLLDVPLPI